MTESLRDLIEEAHADWHSAHQSVPFATLLLTRLAEYGYAVHQDPRATAGTFHARALDQQPEEEP